MSRYAHLEIDLPAGPPTAAEIEAIEAEVGVRLPPAFAAFLLVANGGKLDYWFDVPDGEKTRRLCFYTLYSTRFPIPGTRSAGRILHELEVERRLKGTPRGLLPFAGDGGTSVLYLDLSAEGNGSVVAYVEGLSGWDVDPASCFRLLAPDFESFVGQLYLNTDEERLRAG